MEKKSIKLLFFLFVLTLCLLAKPSTVFAGRKNLANADIHLSSTSYTYTSAGIRPGVTVKLNGLNVSPIHYTVSYSSNINARAYSEVYAKVTIKAISNDKYYYGSKSATFTINRRNIKNTTITLSQLYYTYDSMKKTPTITVKINNNIVPELNYTVTYNNNINAGTATVTIAGKNNLYGTITKEFYISKRSILGSAFKLSFSPECFIYDGKEKKPNVELYNDKWQMKQSVTYRDGVYIANDWSLAHYKIECTNNTNVGTATLKIIGVNNYTGTITRTFKIFRRSDIVKYAKERIGDPYKSGGEDPKGFDCAGFTRYVYKNFSYYLPLGSGNQINYGYWVSKNDLKEGDLVFFNYQNGSPNHVGIYIGNGEYINASSLTKTVTISDINDSNRNTYYSARRLID